MAKRKSRQDDARDYLRSNFAGVLAKSIDERVNAIEGGKWTPATDEQKIQLITCAYAMSLLYGTSSAMIEALKETLHGNRGLNDPRRVFIEALYIDENSERSTQLKLLSTWTIALRHLDSRKVRPTEVAALAGRPAEGIAKWSKASARAKQALRIHKISTVAASKPAQVAIRSDGQIKRWRIGNMAALAGVIAELDRLKKAHPAPKAKKT